MRAASPRGNCSMGTWKIIVLRLLASCNPGSDLAHRPDEARPRADAVAATIAEKILVTDSHAAFAVGNRYHFAQHRGSMVAPTDTCAEYPAAA